MNIRQIKIRHFRSLDDLTIDVDDYTALVGPNGTGKSSVLYALDWFFNGGKLEIEDVHTTAESRAAGTPVPDIDVEVTFANLSEADRSVLGMYGRGELASFRRTWSSEDGKEKMIGNSRQGPGFAAIRGAGNVVEMRAGFRAAREAHPDLPNETNKGPMIEALAAWESDPANADLLEAVPSVDATHMFGFNGEHVLARRIRLVLVPASSIISDEVSSSGRSSAVGQLIGTLLTEAVSSARAAWEASNDQEIAKLRDEIVSRVKGSTAQQQARVNEMLKDLVPMATLEFVPDVPSWSIKSDAIVQTDVVIDGERRDIARQGHGVQRAVLISMLHALVTGPPGGPNGALSESQPEENDRPALVICIEEPETYQHPVRARHFAGVLAKWSSGTGSQVMFATHSPYFVLPDQFRSLRRFRLIGGRTQVQSATIEQLAMMADVDTSKVERVVEKELPHTFSEGFFADSVIFVEGDTDRVVLDGLAKRLGSPLDAKGAAVLAIGGKGNLRIPHSMLQLLGIPSYVIADGDADSAARRHPADAEKRANAEASHRAATESLIQWLPAPGAVRIGSVPVSWRDPSTITDRWAIFSDDLEAELALWPEFTAALERAGVPLRARDVAAMRSAVLEAGLEGLPDSLSGLIAALDDFAA